MKCLRAGLKTVLCGGSQILGTESQPSAAAGKPIKGALIDELRQPDDVAAMYDATFTLHTSVSSERVCTSIWHYDGVSGREPRFQAGAAFQSAQ